MVNNIPWTLTNPLARPYFKGGLALGGLPLDSHDITTEMQFIQMMTEFLQHCYVNITLNIHGTLQLLKINMEHNHGSLEDHVPF